MVPLTITLRLRFRTFKFFPPISRITLCLNLLAYLILYHLFLLPINLPRSVEAVEIA